MKQFFLFTIFGILLFSCSNNAQNKNEATEVLAVIKKIPLGGILTTETGWTMKAIINGQKWTASSIISPDVAGRILGDANDIKIGLPYNRRYMVTGKKISFSRDEAVDLFLPADEGGILGGYKGEMLITKANEQWAEGTFYFTADSDRSDKKAEVIDGFFRISMVNPQK